MNQMKDPVVFYINSRNRLVGTDSNFYYQLDIDTTQNYTHCCCLDISIPKSNYNIASPYNNFTVLEPTTPRIITIPSASYSRTSLKTVLINLLNTGAPSGWNYQITTNNSSLEGDTGKYFFSITGNSSVQPTFIFQKENVWEILGFSVGSFSFNNDSLTPPFVMNLSFENTLYLHSDICQDKNNILQHIYVAQNQTFSFIVWQNLNPSFYNKPFNGHGKNVFYFTLLNEDDTPIDTNGQNINIAICLFKIDETYAKYLKYKLLTSE